MHEYVQKSTRTTLPRKSSGVSGGELNHEVAPPSEGISPSTGGGPAGWELAIIIGCPPVMVPLMAMVESAAPFASREPARSSSDCSRRLVPASDSRVSTVLSQPKAMATTASRMALPNARRIHSPALSERFKAAKTRPPAAMATPKDVAAPAAYANNKVVVCALGPEIAAPVRTSPRIGPAQGAHNRPVATPKSSDDPTPLWPSPDSEGMSRFPRATKGRASQSARRADNRVKAKAVRSSNANSRAYCLIRTADAPPTRASL